MKNIIVCLLFVLMSSTVAAQSPLPPFSPPGQPVPSLPPEVESKLFEQGYTYVQRIDYHAMDAKSVVAPAWWRLR